MKRSAAVPLTVAATLSGGLLAAACAPRDEPLQCVDKTTQRVVPDSLCVRAGVAPAAGAPAGAGAVGTGAASAAAPVAHGGFPIGTALAWYYGGRVVSGLVSGGSYAPLAGRAYRSPGGYVAAPGAGGVYAAPTRSPSASPARSGTVRGGFGATSAGRAGG